jgi:hypothetical protein
MKLTAVLVMILLSQLNPTANAGITAVCLLGSQTVCNTGMSETSTAIGKKLADLAPKVRPRKFCNDECGNCCYYRIDFGAAAVNCANTCKLNLPGQDE